MSSQPTCLDTPAAAPSVAVVSDFAAFLELEPAWTDLLARCSSNHPFLTHEWIRTWWECFGARREMHLVTVYRDGRLVAIAPFMLGKTRLYGLELNQLELMYNAHTPTMDVIVDRKEPAARRVLWSHLRDTVRSWDVVRISQVPDSSPTIAELRSAAAADGFLTGIWKSSVSPYVSASGSFGSYLASLDRRHRANVRNRINRLTRQGTTAVDVITSGPELEDALAGGLRIEELAWKGAAGTAILSDSKVEEFYRVFARRAAQKGWLRLEFLTLSGRRIAFAYALAHGKRLYVLKPGYDPDFAAFSPSKVLTYFMLQQTFDEGFESYEFLGESDDWKLDWARTARDHSWLYIFPPGLRTRVLRCAKFTLAPWLKKRGALRLLFGKNEAGQCRTAREVCE